MEEKKDFSFPNVSGNEFKNHQQVRLSFPQNSENSESLDISSVSREALQNNSSENKSLSGSGIRSLDVKESMSSQSMARSTFGNDSVSSSVPIKLGYWSSLEVLGQANLTYIVTQTRDKIVFVDQHAAHERVVFEKLMSAWKGGKVDIQDFLFPLAIDMSPEKVEALLALSVEVSRLGVHIEALGPGQRVEPTVPPP
jgi:DNA mismatch repair protein MutL